MREREREIEKVCVREKGREKSVCERKRERKVCVREKDLERKVCEKEREREKNVCVRERKRERKVIIFVCVFERERESEIERERTVTGKQAELRTDKARKERIEQEMKDSVDKTKLKKIRKMCVRECVYFSFWHLFACVCCLCLVVCGLSFFFSCVCCSLCVLVFFLHTCMCE